jgi:hypothetical protein
MRCFTKYRFAAIFVQGIRNLRGVCVAEPEVCDQEAQGTLTEVLFLF